MAVLEKVVPETLQPDNFTVVATVSKSLSAHVLDSKPTGTLDMYEDHLPSARAGVANPTIAKATVAAINFFWCFIFYFLLPLVLVM